MAIKQRLTSKQISKIALVKLKMRSISIKNQKASVENKTVIKLGFCLTRKMIRSVFTETKLPIDRKKVKTVRAKKNFIVFRNK